MTWDPDQYLKFASPRLRPALELLARIAHPQPTTILDLGCGPGTVTEFVHERWPDAAITAVDNDRSMLERARRVLPSAEFVDADIATYRPADRFDVVYSNATLHWLDHHRQLLPRIAGWLKRPGIMAVQMPTPDRQPSHEAALAIASKPEWSDRLLPHLRRGAVAAPEDYFDLLADIADSLDIWSVTYLQVLTGSNPVTEWAKGSFLRPLLAQLDDEESGELLRLYSAAMREAYPARTDGTTLLPYNRLFIVAGVH